MMDPPARNSMWRLGYSNPTNYNDNEVFCGGFGGKKNNISIIEPVCIYIRESLKSE